MITVGNRVVAATSLPRTGKTCKPDPTQSTHLWVIVSGTETLTLPNESETIRTISTKSGTVSMLNGTFAGKEILTTEEDGSESATATVYETVPFDVQTARVEVLYWHTFIQIQHPG